MSCSSPSVQAGSGAEPRSGAVLDLGGEKAVRPCRPHDVLRQFGVHNALRWALNSKRVQEGSLLQVVPGGGSCKEAGSSSALSTAASAALGAASARSPPTERPAHSSPAGLPALAAGSVFQAPRPTTTAFWGSRRLCCGEERVALPGLD